MHYRHKIYDATVGKLALKYTNNVLQLKQKFIYQVSLAQV